MSHILAKIWYPTRIIDRFTRLEFLFGLCITLPLVTIIGCNYISHQRQQLLLHKTLLSCERMESKLTFLCDTVLDKENEEGSTYNNDYSSFSSSSTLLTITSSPTLSLLHPDTVPLIQPLTLIGEAPGIKREQRSSEEFQGFHIVDC